MTLIKPQYLIFTLTLLSTFPANAEDRRVMSYYVRQASTQNAATSPAAQPRNTNYLNVIENRAAAPAQAEEAEPPAETQKKETADAVWEHYKALSTGKNEELKPQIAQPAPPESPVATPSPVASSGITGLLSQYQNSKARRSQMNTLRVTPASAINPASAGE